MFLVRATLKPQTEQSPPLSVNSIGDRQRGQACCTSGNQTEFA